MLIKAQICRSGKRSFDCVTEERKIISAYAHATLLKEDHLVVGDWVCLSAQPDGSWWISEVLSRQNFIYRNLPREKKKKVIAANVDLIMIVMSGDKPSYKQGLLDRYLLRSAQWSIPAVLIFNKMDNFLGDFNLSEELTRVKSLGVEAYEISALNPDYSPRFLSQGWTELKEKLYHKTTILLGQSGVGKSRLISSLSNNQVQLLSKDLAKVGKGAHTTTWVELINCGDFKLIDSPGVRSMSIEDIHYDEILELFPDLCPIAQHCQFQNCQHTPSSKGCALLSSQDPILKSRWESFLRLREEANQTKDWER